MNRRSEMQEEKYEITRKCTSSNKTKLMCTATGSEITINGMDIGSKRCQLQNTIRN